jgi:hypothetical protein
MPLKYLTIYLKTMEENEANPELTRQLETATDHHQKVYEVSRTIEARDNEIAFKMRRMEELQKERDQIFEDIIQLKHANILDTQWLKSLQITSDEKAPMKVLPLLNYPSGGQDTAA